MEEPRTPSKKMEALVLSDELEVNTLRFIPLSQLANDIRIIKDTIKSFYCDKLIMIHAFGWDEKNGILPLLSDFSFPKLLSSVAEINPSSIPLDPYNSERFSDLIKRKEVLDLKIKHNGNAASLMREYTDLERQIVAHESRISMMATELTNKIDDILCMHAIRTTECSGILRDAIKDDRITSGNILSQWQAELRNRHRLSGPPAH